MPSFLGRNVAKSEKANSYPQFLSLSYGIVAFLLCNLAVGLYAGTAGFFPAGTYYEKSKKQLIFLSVVLKSETDSWAKGNKSLSLPNLSSSSLAGQPIPDSFEKDGVCEGYQYSVADSENGQGFCINAVPVQERSLWPSFRAEIHNASFHQSQRIHHYQSGKGMP